MKKKLWISSFVLANMLMSTVSMAGSVNAPKYSHPKKHAAPRLFNGIGVTGALGGIFGAADIDLDSHLHTDNPSGFEPIRTSVYEFDLSETSFTGMMGVEYDYQFLNGLLLGLAFTAGFEDLEIKVPETEVVAENFNTPGGPAAEDTSTLKMTFKTKLKNDFAILFKPGFVVRHNTLLYAMVGPRWGNFESELKGSANTQGSVVNGLSWDTTASDSDKSSEYQIGFTAGAGIQQALTDHFRLGIEYAYTLYSDMDALDVFDMETNSVTHSDAIVAGTVHGYDVVTNTVMATLSYQF